jgi:Methyltransferase domain
MNNSQENIVFDESNLQLFEKIQSQTSVGDKESLLFVQKTIRNHLDKYTYLEIGSHLGGSIQTYYVDDKCELIYSIDKRPESQPDERGIRYKYDDNLTNNMLDNLNKCYPEVESEKLITFDSSAKDIDVEHIKCPVDICFIDGEHTNEAFMDDYMFCLKIINKEAAVIVLHDSCIIYKGIKNVKKYLASNNIRYKGIKLKGSVYVFLINNAIDSYEKDLNEISKNQTIYFFLSMVWLSKHRAMNLLSTKSSV